MSQIHTVSWDEPCRITPAKKWLYKVVMVRNVSYPFFNQGLKHRELLVSYRLNALPVRRRVSEHNPALIVHAAMIVMTGVGRRDQIQIGTRLEREVMRIRESQEDRGSQRKYSLRT